MTNYYCRGCERLKESDGHCTECGTLLQPINIDVTPNEDIRELVDGWSEKGDLYAEELGHYTFAHALRDCAEEIERLIGDADE